jgi:hypothetical protein
LFTLTVSSPRMDYSLCDIASARTAQKMPLPLLRVVSSGKLRGHKAVP